MSIVLRCYDCGPFGLRFVLLFELWPEVIAEGLLATPTAQE